MHIQLTATEPSQLTSASADRLQINAIWLMKLRWVAVVGQLITIFVVTFGLGITVHMMPLLFALAITSISNLGFTLWLKSNRNSPESPSFWNRIFATLMALDLAVLTALLFFTGGHANPFVLFYFVNLALSGILLPAKWASLLNLLTVGSFAGLFYFHVPLKELRQAESLLAIGEIGSATLAQKGLLVAFAACSSVIVYFTTRLTMELKLSDRALRRSEARQARSEKWEALGTLAAGAAHELATPLTTIAVVSKEIERELQMQSSSLTLLNDVKMIREELDRCRGILDQMSTDAGHITAETSTRVEVDSLVMQILSGLGRKSDLVDVQVPEELEQYTLEVPEQSVSMAIRGIIQNALDASPDEPVDLQLSTDSSMLCVQVKDRGIGMSQEVLKRADEPFFTTKEAGNGMGLGRFLARSVFERLGGSFSTESTPKVGTVVTIHLPLDRSQ